MTNGVYSGLVRSSELVGDGMGISSGAAVGVIVVGVALVAGVPMLVAYLLGASTLVTLAIGAAVGALSVYFMVNQ